MSRFIVEREVLDPIDPEKLKVNQFVHTDIEYRGQVVEEGYILRVARVTGRGRERIFTLQDMMSRPYNIPFEDLAAGRATSLVFKGVYPRGQVRQV